MSLQTPVGSTATHQQPAGTLPISKLPTARRYSSEVRENMNCKSCRKRKIKCSRTRPSCNACDVFRCECIYDAVPKKRGPKTEVLEELLKRIDGLEKRLGENEGANVTAASPTTEPSNTSSTASRKRQAVSPPEDTSEPSPSAIVIVSTPPACATTTATDEQLVRKLVDVFFQHCNGKPYTLFHEGLFRQQWAEGRVSDHIIDTLCAVAIRYTPAHELGTLSAQEYSEQFAARARRGVDSDEPSLENLQSMLLLSMTYYAMGYGKKSFMQMGLAIRMTLALDLHRELPHSHPASPLEREIRRRVFWTCYLMDRFTVCGSARPPCFSDRSIYLRLPCTEESFRRGMPSESPFFSETGAGFGMGIQITNSNLLVDVVRILGRTIRYTQSGGVKGDSHFPWHAASNLSRIRSELNAWASFRDLREGVPATPDATSLFLARSVWHVIHCIMYRNFLPIDLAELDGNGTQQAWQMEATKVCFQHANALVDLISVAAMTPTIEWPAFAGFCLATAASVLIHGVFYKGSGAFRRCRENLVKVLMQVRALTSFWSCMRQQLFMLKKLYRCHEKLVSSYSPDKRPASVFHLDDFYDRYAAHGGGDFEACHVPFFDASDEDADLSFLGVPPLPAQQTSVFDSLPHPLPQPQQPQPPQPPTQFMEEFPFSPTTPQDLQFLSVANFGGGGGVGSGHGGYEYDDFSSFQQQLQSMGDDPAQDMGGIEQQRDPLLSMLAEMAERDEFAAEGRDGDDGWLGNTDGRLSTDGVLC